MNDQTYNIHMQNVMVHDQPKKEKSTLFYLLHELIGYVNKITKGMALTKPSYLRMIDWLIEYCFSSRCYMKALKLPVNGCKIISRLNSAIMTCEQVRIFIVSFLLWHGASVFAVSIKGSPNYVTVHDKQGGLRTDSSPAPGKYFFIFPEVSRKQTLVVINSIFEQFLLHVLDMKEWVV